MATVIFNPGELQQLHGTFGGFVYRFTYGKQRMHAQPEPLLPKNATKKQREAHDKAVTVLTCIAEIQLTEYRQGAQTVARMQLIADEYPAIKKAVERMYDDFRKYFKQNSIGLTNAIIYWYTCKRLPPKLDLFRDQLPDEYKEIPVE